MSIAVIFPAAGAGTRFNHGAAEARSKLEAELAGKPVFLRAIELFAQCDDVTQMILAVAPDGLEAFKLRWGDRLGFLDVRVVAGGRAERWETVAKALEHVNDDCTHVAVHDAARPMATPAMIWRVFETAKRYHAAVPGLPVSDTLKRVAAMEDSATAPVADEAVVDAILGEAGKPGAGPVQRVVETVDRRELVEVQTPQVFDVSLLRRAYAQLAEGKLEPGAITDDAGLVEALGEPVAVVEGDPLNLKITRPEDLELADAVLSRREAREQTELGKKRLFADDDDEL